MSVTWTRKGADVVALVDAAAGPLTVGVTPMASMERVIVRRLDASSNAVTVTVPAGWQLDGVTNGTLTVPGDGELSLIILDGKIESVGGTASLIAGLSGTYVRSGDPLWAWKQKLATSPSTAKIVGSGDSTMDIAAQAADFYAMLKTVHMMPGEALYGMSAANIVALGYNGSTLLAWLGDSAKLSALVAEAPDLVIASWGINDVRLGLTDQATMRARLVTYIDAIHAALPNTSILLRVPSTLNQTNSGGANYVQSSGGTINPAGAAQSYSDIIRAAHLSLIGAYPFVDIADVPGDLWGPQARVTHPLMSDQIHPSHAGSSANGIPIGGGQVAIADYLATRVGFAITPAPFGSAGRDYWNKREFYIADGGNGYVDLGAPRGFGVAPAQFPITTSDILLIEGDTSAPRVLSSATIIRPQGGTNIRLLISGTDFATFKGRRAWVAFNHPDASLSDRQIVAVDPPSLTAGAFGTATVTVTGVRTGALHDAASVAASPSAAFVSSGVLLLNAYPSADNTVTLVFYNPTAGTVDVASSSWAFWVVR